jgi:phage tail tube protein FII
VGCKAFIKGIPNKIPGIGITTGEASENECTIATTRYNLFVDGVEMFLIDRLAGIVRIAGKNFADIDSLL